MQLQKTVQKQTKKFFDNTFENIEKNAQTQTKTAASSILSQFTGQTPKSDHGTNESGGHTNQQGVKAYDAATAEMVSDLYEPSDPQAAAALASKHLPKAGEMTPEEQAHYQQMKKILHDEYLRKLYERKTAEQVHAEQEQVVQQEKQMEELQVQEQEKDDQNLAVMMQTNKAEQFPGVAG